MPIEVKMAKLSPTMESGQMVRWLVKVGDRVKEGDTIAEIQTDKAVMPMESFDEGTVAALDVKEGDDIALGQRVLLLAKKGEDHAAVAGASASTTQSIAVRSDLTNQEETNTPHLVAAAASASASSSATNGHGHGHAAPASGRVRSTPLARKVARDGGVELGSIPGSGPGGRVVRADVEAFLKSGPAKAPAAAQAPAPARPAAAPGEARRIPHTPMRKTIAKRMIESKQAAPEIHVTVDIRIDALMAVRESLNRRLAPEKIKLSVGDFVTKAAAMSLRAHPGLNASYEADAIVVHPQVHVGIAVAMEGGLMVPVLRNADAMGLKEIRTGTESIASATRSGTLKPNQMMGGTFTISNLGMYGVKQFDAIINQPEVAILAVGAAERRPVVEGDSIVPGTVMSVTLTADHRAVDGAMAAEFLRTFKGFLEEPASMLL